MSKKKRKSRTKPKEPAFVPDTDAVAGLEHRDRQARRQKKISSRAREIGPLQLVDSPSRRAECIARYGKKNYKPGTALRRYCEIYFPERFSLRWCENHLEAIKRLEQSIVRGGLFALAMPRGYGKTSLTEVACLWAILYGYHNFPALIGSTETASMEMLDSVKAELENNDQLAADFPEVCHPIRALEGISNRVRGQVLDGFRTQMSWTQNMIVFPTVYLPEDHPAFNGEKPKTPPIKDGDRELFLAPTSGAVLKVAGITGRVRGMKHTTVDGRVLRPSLVILDDPQTNESAMSPHQCEKRTRIIAADVLGLAGPGKRVSAIMLTTIVRRGDLADVHLDRKLKPEWNGVKTKMVLQFPSNEKAISNAREVWEDALRSEKFDDFHTHWRKNKKTLEAGAKVAWPEYYEPGYVSAIQYAMTLLWRDEVSFFSERQNEPLAGEEEVNALTPDVILENCVVNRAQGVVPAKTVKLIMQTDCHDKALYYTIWAFETDFTAHLVDYGTWPPQPRTYFTLTQIRKTIATQKRKADRAARLRHALEVHHTEMLNREFKCEDGSMRRIDRAGVDCGWEMDTIETWLKETRLPNVIQATWGQSAKATQQEITESQAAKGQPRGLGWYIASAKSSKNYIRRLRYDANGWKSRLRDKLQLPEGSPGRITIFGLDSKGNKISQSRHRMIAEHFCAQRFDVVRCERTGRTVEEWALKVGVYDDHFNDTTVVAMALAASEGISMPGVQTIIKQKSISLRKIKQRKSRRR